MSVTLESVEKINALKNGIEATTGETYADLTEGVQALKDNYGQGGGGTDEIENLIDQSGVLDSTDGTATEKVEQLIDLAEWEKVWYETSERITNINNLFKGYQGVTIPRTNFISATSCGRFIENSKVEYIDYYINTPKVTSFQYGFANAPLLKRMKGFNASNASQVNGVFLGDSLLETIEEPLDFSKVTANMGLAFNGCIALKDISFVAECIKVSFAIFSPKLSADSVQSIFGALSSTATGQTLTLPPVFENADAEAVVTANIEEVDGVKRVKGKEGWTLVR